MRQIDGVAILPCWPLMLEADNGDTATAKALQVGIGRNYIAAVKWRF
jgi:hypothetical protein